MREENQLKLFERALDQYGWDKPLSLFLQEFFRSNKQMGSTDRRLISHLFYVYCRVHHILPNISIKERLAIGCFLIPGNFETLSTYLLERYTSFKGNSSLPLREKLDLIKQSFTIKLEDAFPWIDRLSDGIEKEAFTYSLFTQPRVFTRIKHNYVIEVDQELESRSVQYTMDDELPLCRSFSNATKLTELDSYKKGYFEIQDRSSQKTGTFIDVNPREYWWDCCAASGGKSLMMIDKEPSVNLTVSDIRPSIIENLKERFKKAGISNYKYFINDLTSINSPFLKGKSFDGIVADVPCSGSGTWARTPELLTIFKESELNKFVKIQKAILNNILHYLKPGGRLIYITCSAFKEENELMVEYLQRMKMNLLEMNIIKGYKHQADVMFVARLEKPKVF